MVLKKGKNKETSESDLLKRGFNIRTRRNMRISRNVGVRLLEAVS